MTPRERVLSAIAHKEPDRVPIDQGATSSSGIMAIAYNRLKRRLRYSAGTTFVYDLVQQLARPGQWFLDRFRVDAIDVGRAFDSPERRQTSTLPDGSAVAVPAWFRPERRGGWSQVQTFRPVAPNARERQYRPPTTSTKY